MTFTPEVYEIIREGAKRSAATVAPHLYDLSQPRTVVDVGGGEGWWARELVNRGAAEALVLDSTIAELGWEEQIGTRSVLWGRRAEIPSDLLRLERSFDLALCLEVAEHLPVEYADALIGGLVRAAPVVFFSAAVPGQGGHGHLNEQWPSYWAAKFYEHGLVASEAFRWEFWDDDGVEPWYRQNLLLFARHEWFDAHGIYDFTKYPRACVHPVIWEHRRQRP